MLDDFSHYLNESEEYGVVREVRYPIVTVEGLPHAKVREKVVFEGGEIGEIFTIEKDILKILLFSRNPVHAGTRLTRTGGFIQVPVGSGLLGSIIDPLGNPLSSEQRFTPPKEFKDVEAPIIPLSYRARIKDTLSTGVTIVDLLIPIGKGQRELVVGDRKTGKSSLLYTAVKNQISQGSVVVYTSIGKKRSDIKKTRETFDALGITPQIVFVASSSDDAPPLISLTPHSSMTIAEYFRDLGKNVLVILDDLSTHARFYREISLVAGGFPGRESYPGDIFYLHANLLERAGNFKATKGEERSITCLPVVETVDGDLSNYIASNVMGMTDGHIFFDINAFAQGRRPAINIGLSVTRVGRQTQSPLLREINRELTSFLTEYEHVQTFSHFGAELSSKVRSSIKKGRIFYLFFNQRPEQAIPITVQIVLFGLIWLNAFNEVTDTDFDAAKEKIIAAYEKPEIKKIFDQIVTATTLYDCLSGITRERAAIDALWQKKQ